MPRSVARVLQMSVVVAGTRALPARSRIYGTRRRGASRREGHEVA